MSLTISSLSSGSSGNCYLLRSSGTAILVDAGISARRIEKGLEIFGLEPKGLSGVLISHEHSDHIQGLRVLGKKTGAKVYATGRTLREIALPELGKQSEALEAGDRFSIGDIEINTFSVSHDAADPIGFSFSSGNVKISIVTDTGIVTDGMKCEMENSDILVLEANHDEAILRIGSYPQFLKERILSDKGHLSNEAAAHALAELFSAENSSAPERRTILLAHLSTENNFPEMARMTVSNILEAKGFSVNRNILIETLPRTEQSPVYSL